MIRGDREEDEVVLMEVGCHEHFLVDAVVVEGSLDEKFEMFDRRASAHGDVEQSVTIIVFVNKKILDEEVTFDSARFSFDLFDHIVDFFSIFVTDSHLDFIESCCEFLFHLFFLFLFL